LDHVKRAIAVALSIALSGVCAGCTTVTHASKLDAEPARIWLRDNGNGRVSVDSPGAVTVEGRIVSATGGVIQLLDPNGGVRDIPVRDGTAVREKLRARGAILGLLCGVAIGVTVGLVAGEGSGASRQNATPGGLVVPISALLGVFGAIIGGTAGAERRLEVSSTAR
jgi:hypothetical protein